MTQSYVSENGTLYIPGTYVSQNVISTQSNGATAGVVTIIGEASNGPDFTQEADLNANSFAPDQIGDIIAKYGSGRIIDAFRALVAASPDPAILGAVNLVKIVKTNISLAASLAMSRQGFGAFSTTTAKQRGQSGNLIKVSNSVAIPESEPTTGSIAYCPKYNTSLSFAMRANGGSQLSVTVTPSLDHDAFIAATTDLVKGILSTGGSEVTALVGLATKTLVAAPVSGSTTKLQITLQSGSVFSSAPAVGDTMIIVDSDFGTSHSSAIKGSGPTNNVGSYIITQVSNTASNASIIAERINAPTGANIGSASGVVHANEDDILVFKPIQISNKSGMDRQALVGMSGLFTCTSNDGTNVVLSGPTAFTAQAKQGDYVRIPALFAGINPGLFLVTSSTSTTISMSILSNGSSGTTGSTNVVTAIIQSTQPVIVMKPTIDGLGKSMEISGSVEAILRNKSTTVGASLSNQLLVSAAEEQVSTVISRGAVSDTFRAGGDIVLQISCSQADAKAIISDTMIDFQISSVSQFTVAFSQFKTMQDVADYISSQTDFSAQIASARFAAVNPANLDNGTFDISTSLSAFPARIKQDGYSWSQAIAQSSLASASQPSSGLPEVLSPAQFLSGGSLGASTGAQFAAAIDACEVIDTNFIIPLVSQDASVDISLGETDSSSTYSVDAVNAYLKAHVIKMSALKQRSNRLAVVSKKGTYAEVKEAASQIASFRVAMAFQDIKNSDSTGAIQQFQPWMGAIIAAGMQAAAGYKGIVKKFANISGIVNSSDFNSSSQGQKEDALRAGLLILERVNTGGFRWVSDQMTYSVDNNFVYNSLQAVYVADLMALTLIATFDRAIVGKSVAEVSAASARSILESVMFDFMRLRWIAPSLDAPKGFKDVSIKLIGGVMNISVNVKIAGIIYFVPVSLNISEVQQSA
jgi:hypothetical protein